MCVCVSCCFFPFIIHVPPPPFFECRISRIRHSARCTGFFQEPQCEVFFLMSLFESFFLFVCNDVTTAFCCCGCSVFYSLGLFVRGAFGRLRSSSLRLEATLNRQLGETVEMAKNGEQDGLPMILTKEVMFTCLPARIECCGRSCIRGSARFHHVCQISFVCMCVMSNSNKRSLEGMVFAACPLAMRARC